ncbi:MAG: T9SS type A sorting domain-containing protein [Bacteroidetes bacterium]|nr:T9SS type A sorting domain-containing protein [Bacteroidota bacterium]
MKKSLLLIISISLFSILSIQAQPLTWVWATAMGGKANYDSNLDLARDAQGNIYITGDFTGTKSFGAYTLIATGFSEVFVAKFDPTGNCLWAVKAGANFSSAFASSIAFSGSQLYVGGLFTNNINCGGVVQTTLGNNDGFLMKLDPATGACTWIINIGGLYNDVITSVTPENSGGIFICGTFTDAATFGTVSLNSGSVNNIDMFLAKYNTDGTCAWAVKAGGGSDDKANSVKQLPGGAIFMTGYFQGTSSFGTINVTSVFNYDFFLAKYDGSGNASWVQTGGGNGNDIGYSIGTDASANIYVTGFIGDTASFSGTTIFDNEYGSIIVAKYNNGGFLQWIKTAGGAIDDSGYDISTDAGGSSYISGYVNGNSNFSGTILSGVQGRDGFLAKYDPSGIVKWVARVGSTGFDIGKSIVNDANGFCYVAGDFSGTVTLGTNQIVSPPGEWSVYLARAGGGTLSLKDDLKESPFTIFPNPAKEFINFNFKNITDAVFTLELLSIEGKFISSTQIHHSQVQSGFKLDVSTLQNGNYLVKINTSKGDFTRTVVVDHR